MTEYPFIAPTMGVSIFSSSDVLQFSSSSLSYSCDVDSCYGKTKSDQSEAKRFVCKRELYTSLDVFLKLLLNNHVILV